MAAPSTGAGPKRFDDIELPECVRSALRVWGYTHMTPVQAAVIPLFAAHKDVAAQACTGSGKTLAFLIPLVDILMRLDGPAPAQNVCAIVLSPTRELAKQTFDIVGKLIQDTWIRAQLLVGGTDVASDAERCEREGCHIVIATPGRLMDVLTRFRERVCVSKLEVLILDEADTLLDMGFADTITQILDVLPKQRRTGLFSATQTSEVKALARAGLRNPAVVTVTVQLPARASAASRDAASTKGAAGAVEPRATAAAASTSVPSTLSNKYMLCSSPSDKLDQLCAFLRTRAERREKTIVFVLTCAAVDFLAAAFSLESVRKYAKLPSVADMPILPLHGQMAPKKRTGNYARFLEAPTGVLLCTDVAARGIDVPDVDWIVQYDPPKDPAFFIHRVGRTARAGRSGCALVLLLPKESTYVQLMGVKHVPLEPMPRLDDDDAHLVRDVGISFQDAATADRDILEKSTKAFMGFMRGYGEHLCKYIFKPDQLDISSLALSFGLLKLPKLDELRAKKIDYTHARAVDTSKIEFLDKTREAQRQQRLAASAEQQAADRAARDERRAAAMAAAARAAAGEVEKRKRKHKGQQARMFEDWELLAREERLEKRLKQGRISKAEYKREMAALHKEQGVDEEEGDLQTSLAVAMAPVGTREDKPKNVTDDSDSQSDGGDGDEGHSDASDSEPEDDNMASDHGSDEEMLEDSDEPEPAKSSARASRKHAPAAAAASRKASPSMRGRVPRGAGPLPTAGMKRRR